MRKLIAVSALWMCLLCACGGPSQMDSGTTTSPVSDETQEVTGGENLEEVSMRYTTGTKISEITDDPVFGDYGN